MKTLISALVVMGITLASGSAQAWKPDFNDKFELSVAQAIARANDTDPTLTMWFESAYAYAVYPSVGKGGFIVGGAHGKGLVIQGDRTVGTTTLNQLTVGAQLGGQAYAEYIMFKDQSALEDFTRGNYEFGAQVSAVALSFGASADADYDKGVAIFTLAKGGLMFEASVGGQKFSYEAR